MTLTRKGGDIQIAVLAVVEVQLDWLVNRLVAPTILLVLGLKELHRRGEGMLSIYLPERLEYDFGVPFVFATQFSVSVFTSRGFVLDFNYMLSSRSLGFAFAFKSLANFFPVW
jgi:hypothetical protein